MGGALVIGVGSDLRRDDAAGRHVAEQVAALALRDVAVIVTTQLLPELVEPISAAERVVFVDASVSVAAVTVAAVEPVADAGHSHHATPGALLGLGERLGLAVPPAVLVEIPAHDLSLGEGLSAGTCAFVDVAVADVLAIVGG
jgi:hydrogenase maturation protease